MMAIKEIVLWGPKLKWLLSAVPNLKIVSTKPNFPPFISSNLAIMSSSSSSSSQYRYGWYEMLEGIFPLNYFSKSEYI
jgi:hypothetical protein